MTRSKLATRTSGNAGQYSSRNGRKIKGWIIHHAASTSLGSVLGMMSSASRQLSANYVVSGATIVSVVPEEHRAWTSSSPKGDGERLTVEIINDRVGSNDSNWTISDASYESMARLIADTSKRYGFAINRSTIIGHREVRGIYGEGYATACPSGIDLDRLVKLANKYKSGKSTGTPSASKPTTKPATAKTGYKGIALGSNDAAASSNKVDRWVKAPGGEPNGPYWPEGKLMERIQKALKNRGRYNGPTDGKGAGETAKGIQQTLNISELNGVKPHVKTVVDGKLGRNNAYGVQHYAAKHGDYIGALDGDPRANSWIGFALGLERP